MSSLGRKILVTCSRRSAFSMRGAAAAAVSCTLPPPLGAGALKTTKRPRSSSSSSSSTSSACRLKGGYLDIVPRVARCSFSSSSGTPSDSPATYVEEAAAAAAEVPTPKDGYMERLDETAAAAAESLVAEEGGASDVVEGQEGVKATTGAAEAIGDTAEETTHDDYGDSSGWKWETSTPVLDMQDEGQAAKLDSWTWSSDFAKPSRANSIIPIKPRVYLTVDEVVGALEQQGAFDVRVVDTSTKTAEFDAMIFCNGKSSPHMRSLADVLVYALKKRKLKDAYGSTGAEGYDCDDWMLVDCGNLIVHIFEEGYREELQLERHWEDVPPFETISSRQMKATMKGGKIGFEPETMDDDGAGERGRGGGGRGGGGRRGGGGGSDVEWGDDQGWADDPRFNRG